MTKGKTILEMMQEQEPLNDYDAETICELYCNDGPIPCKDPCSWAEKELRRIIELYGPIPCKDPCSWLELFTKKRFVEVVNP